MRFRASAGALIVTAALLSTMSVVSTGASAATCDYPTNAPVADLQTSTNNATAGQTVTLFGSYRRNSCAISGASVRIQRRYIVSGSPTGAWRRVARTTTNSHGLFAVSQKLRRNIQYRAYMPAYKTFPPTHSNRVSIRVHTRITEAVARPGACRLTFAGSTFPVKAFRTVRIQKRGSVNHFHGWTTIARVKTGTHGNYKVTVPLVCGKTYNTSALIAGDTINYSGRSATIYGIVAAH
jgi:hypothetical protein